MNIKKQLICCLQLKFSLVAIVGEKKILLQEKDNQS